MRQRIILDGDPEQRARMLATLPFGPAEVGRHKMHMHTYTRDPALPDAKFAIYKTKRAVVVRQLEPK